MTNITKKQDFCSVEDKYIMISFAKFLKENDENEHLLRGFYQDKQYGFRLLCDWLDDNNYPQAKQVVLQIENLIKTQIRMIQPDIGLGKMRDMLSSLKPLLKGLTTYDIEMISNIVMSHIKHILADWIESIDKKNLFSTGQTEATIKRLSKQLRDDLPAYLIAPTIDRYIDGEIGQYWQNCLYFIQRIVT